MGISIILGKIIGTPLKLFWLMASKHLIYFLITVFTLWLLYTSISESIVAKSPMPFLEDFVGTLISADSTVLVKTQEALMMTGADFTERIVLFINILPYLFFLYINFKIFHWFIKSTIMPKGMTSFWLQRFPTTLAVIWVLQFMHTVFVLQNLPVITDIIPFRGTIFLFINLGFFFGGIEPVLTDVFKSGENILNILGGLI